MTQDSEIRESVASNLAELVGGKPGDEAARSPQERVSSPSAPTSGAAPRKRVLGRLARPMAYSSPLWLSYMLWGGLAQLSGPHPASRVG